MIIKEIFGSEYNIMSIEPLLGGAQKHTYIAKCKNGFSFVIYCWGKNTTYFENNSNSNIFRSSGSELFKLNNLLIREKHILTPEMYYMNQSREELDYEYAFVEYISGVDMDYIMMKEQDRIPLVIKSLEDNISKLHSIKSDKIGQLGNMQDKDFDLLQYILMEVQDNCNFLLEYDREYKEEYIRAINEVMDIANNIKKRSTYTFIHAELGPNHVIVDKNNQAYLIDIEGARFCDAEEEDSFIKFRFQNLVSTQNNGIETDRMKLYHLAHCFGILRGAIELKNINYYDMDDVNEMINFFHSQFLKKNSDNKG